MNVQYLAAMFGLSMTTAYGPDGGNDYAISGAFDAANTGGGSDIGNGGLTNSFQEGTGIVNPAVLSTVGQIQAYLNSTGGVADPSALYVISSGANDSAYVRSQSSSRVVQDNYLAPQAQTLANEIVALYDAGARHILVDDIGNKAQASIDYSEYLYEDLDRAGVPYIKSDIHELSQTVQDNPTNYGFTATTVSTNDPALIEPDPNTADGDQKGYGLWGAATTTQESNSVSLVDQYSYLQELHRGGDPLLCRRSALFGCRPADRGHLRLQPDRGRCDRSDKPDIRPRPHQRQFLQHHDGWHADGLERRRQREHRAPRQLQRRRFRHRQ